MSAEEERIRQWKAQLQREMAGEEEEGADGHDALIANHPVVAPLHFADEPLSDDEAEASSSHPAGDDDLGLDLEEPAYRDKAPAHPTTFELPKGLVTKQRAGHADPELATTQATVDTLQAALHERDIEIQRLRRAAEGEGPGRPDDLRDQRLRELAKKNRQLVQFLGKERAQNAVLAGEMASLRAAAAAPHAAAAAGRAASAGTSARAAAAAAGPSDDAPSLRELRDKLAASTAKLQESRQGQQALRAELAKAHRALAKEVGEDVPLPRVLEEGGSWRGRAQQITLLKAKLAELRRSASAAGASGEADAAGAAGSSAGGHAVDDKARSTLAAIEQERRREFERLALREQELTSERADDKAKLEAVLARVKILEAEQRAGRAKLKLLLTKSDDDDELVLALQAQLGKLAEQRPSGPAGERAGAGGASAAELAEVSARNEELAAQNAAQEQIILFLRDQLSRASAHSDSAREAADQPAAPALGARYLEVENGKLRELCQLLQDKLAQAPAVAAT